MIIVELDAKFMETCGDYSLEGHLVNLGVLAPHQEITLRFLQTSRGWRHEHGGPDIWIMTEFAVPCLLQSVLGLAHKGYQIKIEMSERR